MMSINKGFTLVELIIVIVILGILSVVAAPKFIDISEDAIASTNKGIFAALKSAVNLVQAKALASGVSKDGVVSYNGTNLKLYNYWPECLPPSASCALGNVSNDGRLSSPECIAVFNTILQNALEDYQIIGTTGNDYTCEVRHTTDNRYGFNYRPLGETLTIVEP